MLVVDARRSKKRSQALEEGGWVIAPEASAEFVASMERVLDVYRRPRDETARIKLKLLYPTLEA